MPLKSILESILFVHGEPIDLAEFAHITKRAQEEIRTALEALERDYMGRGLVILRKDDSWQLGTNPENAPYIEELVKSQFSQELTRASLETLAIIAYKGPLTRPQIEYIRGVNSSFTVRTLLMRGLVERMDNPKDARSYLYRVSLDFLKHLGLTKMEDLPNFEEFRKKEVVPEPEMEEDQTDLQMRQE